MANCVPCCIPGEGCGGAGDAPGVDGAPWGGASDPGGGDGTGDEDIH
jgi:hypothetical protein